MRINLIIKFLLILVLSLLVYNPSSFAIITGKGEVKLSERALQNFMWYLRGDWAERKKGKYVPAYFILSSDGTWSTFMWCPYNECWSNERPDIQRCESETGVKCGAFAVRRKIHWDNGINTSKKKAKFSSKMSDEEVISKLITLGFYGEAITKAEPEVTEDIVTKLKDLQKLYNEGALTKEEFENAKKKILN